VGIVRGQVSTIGTVGAATSVTTSWGTNPVAGQTVICFLQYNGAQANLSVADNGVTASTFTIDAVKASGSPDIYILRANNITLPASGSYSVTATYTASGAGTASIGGAAYWGVSPGAPYATNTGTNAGSASVSSGTVTPAVGGSLFFAAFTDHSSLNPETITLTNASLTEQFTVTNGSSYWACGCADGIPAGTSAQAGTWTLGDSTSWNAAIAVYSPGPPAPPLIVSQAVARAANY
jgi:hypothetical protein